MHTSSGSDSTLAIVLGVILPITLLLVVLAILFAVLLLGYMRYKRPKVILKVLNIPHILLAVHAHARTHTHTTAHTQWRPHEQQEPNYQLLVWRRDSMESNEGMKMLPMRRLNLKVQSVLIEVLPFPQLLPFQSTILLLARSLARSLTTVQSISS
jgi:hypothetical protein